jgi:hypothetical protein
MGDHGKHKKDKPKKGKGLHLSEREKKNFKAFQKGFKSATSGFGIKKRTI